MANANWIEIYIQLRIKYNKKNPDDECLGFFMPKILIFV